MMRMTACALGAMLLLVATTQAQEPNTRSIPGAPAPRDPLPRFTIAPRGGPLAPIGLPLPRIGLPPPSSPPDRGRRSRDRAWYPWPAFVFYVPQPVLSQAPAPEQAREPIEEPLVPGRLVLDIAPAGAQVFADGYYVGLSEDFSASRGGGLLEPGTHRIDVSAPGYEPMTTDLRVTAGQPVTIRGGLKSLPPPVALPPSTFYLIPGCYMGNIPPKDAHLPASCDQSRTVTWTP